jgi:archaellum component FlaC
MSKPSDYFSPRAVKNLRKYGQPVSSDEVSDFTPSSSSTSTSDEEKSYESSNEEEGTFMSNDEDNEETNDEDELYDKLEELLENIKIVRKGVRAKTIADSSNELEGLLLIQEDTESEKNFLMRKTLTKKIATLDNPKINWISAMVVSSMIMKKANLGVTYSKDIEEAITYLMNLLEQNL